MFLVTVVTAAAAALFPVFIVYTFLLVGQLLRCQTPCRLFVFDCAGRLVVGQPETQYHGNTRQTAQYTHTDRGADGVNKTKRELRVSRHHRHPLRQGADQQIDVGAKVARKPPPTATTRR